VQEKNPKSTITNVMVKAKKKPGQNRAEWRG